MHEDTRKIVLLDPPTFAERNLRVSRHLIPNIGMAYVAARLRAAGNSVLVMDPNAEGISARECADRIVRIAPQIVGMSVMTHSIADAGRMSSLIKLTSPGAKILLGGVHITAAPAQTMKEFADVDFGVFGEGEDAAVELADFILHGLSNAPEGLPGVAYRIGDQTVLNRERKEKVDLDAQPFPAWDLFQLDRYSPIYSLSPGKRQLPVTTSRGCPFECVFCNNVNGRVVRHRDIGNVLEEIQKDIEEYKVGSIQFVDESLTLSTKRATSLFEGMIKKGIGERIEWACETRADSLTPDILKLMKESGCAYIAVGIESGNQRVLDRTGKKLELERAREVIDWITKAGINADALFLIGLPYDTSKTILETIRFARGLNTRHASFSNVVPFPGTEIQRMAERGEGGVKILTTDWNEYARHINYAMELEQVSLQKLKLFHLFAYLFFYSKPGRLMEFFKKLNLSVLPLYIANLLFKQPCHTTRGTRREKTPIQTGRN